MLSLAIVFLEVTGLLHSFFKKMSAKYISVNKHTLYIFLKYNHVPLKKVTGSSLTQTIAQIYFLKAIILFQFH